MKTSKLLFVMLMFFTSVFAQTNKSSDENKEKQLLIIVDGIKEIKGHIMIGIYDTDTSFMKKPIYGLKVLVENETIEIPIEIEYGTYAIAVYHDLNDNMKLDKGAFGIPTEPYGFSNNASGFMGAPSFEKSKFEFPKTKVVRINVQ